MPQRRARSADGDEPQQIGRSYRKGINKGLLKILSKMGISHHRQLSRRAAVRDRRPGRRGGRAVLHGTPSAASRAPTSPTCEADAGAACRATPGTTRKPHRAGRPAASSCTAASTTPTTRTWCSTLQAGGADRRLRRLQGLRRAGRQPPGVDAARPAAAASRRRQPLPLDEVEPVEAILTRFDSAGMSLGALSPEAHEALADRDEPPRRALQLRRRRRGSGALRHREDARKIKQVASGRFGVTPRLPGQRRGAADQDGAGRQARRGRPAARRQGQRR